jgi:hypothetical protein
MRASRNKISLKKRRKKAPKGDDLFNQVIKLTGIPQKTIRRELKSILERKNIDVNQLTLEQLRCVVASYLREIMGNLLDRAGHRRSEPHH